MKLIIKLQAIWRGKMVRKHFYHLFHTVNPPYKIVKHFSCLLIFNLEDYHRELELQVGDGFYYFVFLNLYLICYIIINIESPR